jgi:hypothetical protein
MKNYNCCFRILFVLCALMLHVFSNSPVTAATFSIGSMNITSGIYTVWDSSGALIINPDTGNTVSSFTTFGSNTNLASGYIGNGGTGVPATTSDSRWQPTFGSTSVILRTLGNGGRMRIQMGYYGNTCRRERIFLSTPKPSSTPWPED